MVQSSVRRYGFINAKLRARISIIMSDSFKEGLIQASSLEETFQILQDSSFSSLTSIYDRTGDLQSVEAELFCNQIRQYGEIIHQTEGDVEAYIRAMTVKLEIENLKNILRLWYGSRVKKRPIGYRAGYIYKEKILHSISWDSLVNAVSFDDILIALEGTPYHGILSAFKDVGVETSGIFNIETTLDRFYYEFLRDKAEALPKRDRLLVLKVLEAEIDLQNLSWIIRYKQFYNLDTEALLGILIPGGYTFKVEDLKSFMEAQGAHRDGGDPGSLLSHRYSALNSLSKMDGNKSMGAGMFETLLEETRKSEFMKIITGYPFTIGIVLVYFFLKSRESRFLMGILNGKYYGWDSRQIREFSR